MSNEQETNMSSKETVQMPVKVDKPSPSQPPEEKSELSFAGSAEAGHELRLTHKDALKTAFFTDCDEQAGTLLSHCLNALAVNEASDKYPANDQRAFMLSMVNDIKPKDPVERMLAVQMAATHVAVIRAGRWLATSDNLEQVKAHYNGYNKLTRSFASQMEALRKHRNGGQQKVRVEHVTVNEGGQAIVGNVETGGRGKDGK